MSAVKQEVFNKILSEAVVLDFGIGRGQDLYKYQAAKVRHVIGVDGDIQALQESVERKLDLLFTRKQPYENSLPRLDLLHCDLKGNQATAVLQDIKAGHKINAVVCMFALHYFATNPLIYDIFAQVVSKGFALISLFDKDAFNALMGNSTHYKRGVYEYKRKAGSNQIQVKLPFSDQLYTEELVDQQVLIDTLSRKNMALVQRFSFNSEVLEKYPNLVEIKRECSQVSIPS